MPTTTIPDGSLDITKFASGIVPPRVVDALPDLPDSAFPAGSLAFLTTDGRLYRTTTGAAGTWENMVNAADLTGTIDASQIAAGSIGASLLDPSIKTIRPVDALPALPDPDYPLGSVVLETADGTLYKASEAVDLVPVMSGPSAPSGTASASSEVSSTYAAWKAFDDDAGSKWYPNAVAGPWWVRYQFAIPRVITLYRLTPPGATYAPRTWTLEGSNDGGNWTVLDTRTDVADWVTNTPKGFAVANKTSYAYYRLNCSAANGAVTCALVQFEMCGYTLPGAAPPASKITLADLDDDVLAALVPLGTIVEWDEFTQGAIPAGYHLCDGSAVNGRTLPDLRDKFIVGSGAAYAAGVTGGAVSVSLASGNLPAHVHTIDHDHGSATSGGQSVDHTHSGTSSTVSQDHTHSGTTGGQSQGHTHAESDHRHAANVPVVRANAAGTISSTGRWGSSQSREVSAGDYVTDFGGPGTTNAQSNDHTHGFTTGGISANHTHTLTTGGVSAGHTHAVDLPNYTGNSGNGPGSGTAHENRPPYYALAFIMRVA